MAEEPKEKNAKNNPSGDYQFINETIVPKRKCRWKKRLLSVAFTIVLAIIFGLVAQLVFLLAGEPLRKLLGMEESGRQEVNLPGPTEHPTKKPTMTPQPTATTVPTSCPKPTDEGTLPSPDVSGMPEPGSEPANPTEGGVPEPSVKPSPGGTVTEPGTVTPEPTSGAEVTGPSQGNQNSGNGTQENISGDWYSYAMFYEEVIKLAEQAGKSLVTIEAVEIGVDWFQETYEIRTSMTGLVLANDGVDLLLLTGNEKLASADLIEVHLGGELVEGRIFSADADYGLAVIAVALASIPEEVLTEVQIGKIATESQIQVGTPVIALGAPNSYDGSMEFGMITSLGSSVPVTDGQVSYFTTNLTDYAQGYGFILNLNGEVLGMITHTHKVNVDDGVSSAISLDAVRGIIVKLLNASNMAYFGIHGENLPAAVQQASGIAQGVYVREVENASPALAAGIKTGDVLITAGGNELGGIRDFTKVLLAAKERETLTVKLLRTTGEGIREITVDVLLTRKK